MDERQSVGQRMRDHYERVWREDDPWKFESSELDAKRFLQQFALLNDRHYGRTLEIGCGSGHFTNMIADISEEVVALDIAPAAIERAKAKCVGKGNIVFRAENIMDFKPGAEGVWDLIVMSETIYCLGWLYSVFDVGWLMAETYSAMRTGGRFLLVNTKGQETDYLLVPWLIATYRDLFVNIGYRLETEEIFSGTKDGVKFDVLMSLFTK